MSITHREFSNFLIFFVLCRQLDHPQVKEIVATVRRQSIENQGPVRYIPVHAIEYLMCLVVQFRNRILTFRIPRMHRILSKTPSWKNCGII